MVALPFHRAAEELSVNQRMIAPLIKAGCLKETTHAGRRAVTQASIEDCQRRFVTTAIIAKAARSNTRTIIARLKSLEINPVVDGSSSNGISFVWRRCVTVLALME
jgi:hypothetical protein